MSTKPRSAKPPRTRSRLRSQAHDEQTEGPRGTDGDDGDGGELHTLLRSKCPFGPAFFLTQLAVFVRDRCPDASERLPAVEIHLGDGTILPVCHVIDLTRSCVVLAVDDREVAGVASMRTELVPYGLIVRVTIRAFTADGVRLGFTPGVPTILQGDRHETAHGQPAPPPA